MGRREHPLVWYYGQNPHFAGLINGWLFHGEGRLCADDLAEADRRFLTRRGRCGYQGRYRDLYKRIGRASIRLLIGVEA